MRPGICVLQGRPQLIMQISGGQQLNTSTSELDNQNIPYSPEACCWQLVRNHYVGFCLDYFIHEAQYADLRFR